MQKTKQNKNIGDHSCIHNPFVYIFVTDPTTPPPKIDPTPPKPATIKITTKSPCKCPKQGLFDYIFRYIAYIKACVCVLVNNQQCCKD